MNGIIRAVSTLAGVALAGFLLWVAAQIGRHSTGGYWAAYAIVAAAGVVLALSQLRGRTGNPPAMLGLAFLPVLVVSGWVLLALEPHGNWFRDHVLAWSGDLGVRGAVLDLGTWIGVLALAVGYTLGLTLEPAPRRQVVPTYDAVPEALPEAAPEAVPETAAADEPLAAERLEVPTAITEASTTTDVPARVP